jgi:hypothetical protein
VWVIIHYIGMSKAQPVVKVVIEKEEEQVEREDECMAYEGERITWLVEQMEREG